MNFDIENLIYQIGLEQLKKKGSKFTFRCCICKDSKKSDRKKRGWILQKDGNYFYHCFNCEYSKPLQVFLKEYYYTLYLQYVKIILLDKGDYHKPKEKEVFHQEYDKLDLIPIHELDSTHSARRYLSKRKIPLQAYSNFYFCYSYQDWINEKIPDKFTQPIANDERIVWPIYNRSKKIVGVQGRSIKKYGLRYITVMFAEDGLNVCGLDKVKRSEKIYVTEGYLDSLFLSNAISINSSNVDLDKLLDVADKQMFVFVYDNEKRNNQITNRMLKVIDKGFKICIWPKIMDWGKDINKMIENGHKIEDVKKVIDDNTFDGISAKARLKLR